MLLELKDHEQLGHPVDSSSLDAICLAMSDFNFRVGLRILPLRAAHNVNREGEIQNPQVRNPSKNSEVTDNDDVLPIFQGKVQAVRIYSVGRLKA